MREIDVGILFCYLNFLNKSEIEKKIIFIITIVAPVGISSLKEKIIPNKTERRERQAEMNIEILKLFSNCKAVIAGIIRSAETSMTPTTFILNTTVIPVNRDNPIFVKLVLIPEAKAYSSSKVEENRSQ